MNQTAGETVVAGKAVADQQDGAMFGRLLQLQKAVAEAMSGLLDEAACGSMVQRMLELILEGFGASRAHIFTFDAGRNDYSCFFEALAPEELSVMGSLQRLPVAANAERLASLASGRTLDGCDEQGYWLCASLSEKGSAWGFISLSGPGVREWAEAEREAFVSVAHMTGVSLSLCRTQEKAAGHNAFLDKLYRNMPLGYFRLRIDITPEGRVTDYEYLDANTKFLEIQSTTREELIGKMHSEIGPIFTNKLELQTLYEVAYRGLVYESKANKFRSNGRYYDTVIYSPQRGDVVALFTDVTEAVEAAQALRYSEQELKKVYTNIPVGIEIYDRRGVMVEVNDKEVDILGVPDKSHLLGRNLFEHPSFPAAPREALLRGEDVTFDVIMDDTRAARASYYGIPAAERQTFLTIKAVVLRGAAGEVENYLLIIIDNTTMYKALARAEESDRLKSAFLANMSHEIRTPLNAIVGFSGVLAQAETEEEKREFVSIIQKNTEHLLGLISDVLDLSKIEAGMMEVRPLGVRLDELCREAAASFALRANQGVDLRFLDEGRGASMFSDPKLLTQVITNLIANAVKFTSHGHIWLRYTVDGDQVEFSVEDTGLGMTPEQTASVFGRFVKANDFVPGTGLGLSICKGIVEKLGGQIGVESTQGVGSRFCFRVPVHYVPPTETGE